MSTERLHDTHGNIKVTCPHGCGQLIWHGEHDGKCPGQPTSDSEKHLAPLLGEVDEFGIIIGLKDKIKHLLDDAYHLGYGQGLEDAY